MRKDAIGLFWEDVPEKKAVAAVKVKRQPPNRTWELPTYLPYLEEARRFDFEVMTDYEIEMASLDYLLKGKVHEFLFDIECYRNYFLAAFKSISTGKIVYFEMGIGDQLDTNKLKWFLQKFRIIGFNSNGYDIPMVTLACAGFNCEELKGFSDNIINEEIRGFDIVKTMRVEKLKVDSIDLIEVAPLKANLKIYGARCGSRRIQELPVKPDATLSQDQKTIVRYYCISSDLDATHELLKELDEQLELRTNLSNEFGIDLRSKSDAQIAESVIRKRLESEYGIYAKRPEIEVGTVYKYNVPDFIQFKTPLMQDVLNRVQNADFVVGENGAVGMPTELDLGIPIANAVYKLGIGGLHSTEKTQAVYAGKDYILRDIDVTSFYPYIILILRLFPKHIGEAFLAIYRAIVERRVAAKIAGLKVIANSLKIVINGSFGKLGSKYSILYSPDLLIQVTITGQLSLLMLIERLELAGIPVVSANTDGIVTKCPKDRESELNAIVKQWEADTQFTTESTDYLALLSRDVNNYIAVKVPNDKGEVTFKSKGAYAHAKEVRLSKNPNNEISIIAIEEFLGKGVPIEKTIKECTDIKKFVTVRTVKGGAVKVWDRMVPDHTTREELLKHTGWQYIADGEVHNWYIDREDRKFAAIDYEKATQLAYEACLKTFPEDVAEYLGKSIRFYYAGVAGEIVYANNGNKVPKSDGAKPLMQLPEHLPNDIDYGYYINEATEILKDIGYLKEAA